MKLLFLLIFIVGCGQRPQVDTRFKQPDATFETRHMPQVDVVKVVIDGKTYIVAQTRNGISICSEKE